MPVAEYLRREADGEVRHEYVAGVTYAMTGTTLRHNLLLMNVARRLSGPAAASGCHVFVNDVKVRAAADVFYYPDVVVACGPLDDQAVYVTAPCCIVEVLSASTRRLDRTEKLQAYRAMPTVRAYLMVEQRRQWVEAYVRGADGEWVRSELTAGDSVTLSCLGYTLAVADIYEGVSLPAVGEPEPDAYDA